MKELLLVITGVIIRDLWENKNKYWDKIKWYLARNCDGEHCNKFWHNHITFS